MQAKILLEEKDYMNRLQIQPKLTIKQTIFPLQNQLKNQEGCVPSSPVEHIYSSKVCKHRQSSCTVAL